MNIKIVMLISMVFQTFLFAEKELHHEHLGETNVKLNYEFLDFENSKKKTDGKRYGIEFQNSYFLDVGKKNDKLELHLRYARHNANCERCCSG